MAYFLISVSTKTNLDLCIRYALAGFTNSINGLWTFLEVQEGDFISFLYGARVFNLYRVLEKEAIKDADKVPPWPPVTFKMSGKTYHFPFRVHLEPIRSLDEPMVRPEFAYVAENLLLRGGYRKTHFQADQTTLQSVSQMGSLHTHAVDALAIGDHKTFTPMLTWNRGLVAPPEVFHFRESILQTLLRHFLSDGKNLQRILAAVGLNNIDSQCFEMLGEKALPEGHIDILIKESAPRGLSRRIIVEVKSGDAKSQDIDQLHGYMQETGDECLAGVLIGKAFSRKTLVAANERGIRPFVYGFEDVERSSVYSFTELQGKIRLAEA